MNGGRFRCSAQKKTNSYPALFITDSIFIFFCLEKNLNRRSESVKDVQDALVTTLDREGPAHCEFSCYTKIKSGNS